MQISAAEMIVIPAKHFWGCERTVSTRGNDSMRILLALVVFLTGIAIGIALHHHYKTASKPNRVIRPM